MKKALAASDLAIVQRAVPSRTFAGAVRRSEWIIIAFLIYASAASFIFRMAPTVKSRLGLLNLAVILAYGLLIHLDSPRRTLTLGVVRDWLPLGLVLLAYREVGWFAQPHQSHLLESHWVFWDRLVVRGGGKALVEAFGPVWPSILEMSYTLVYALAPFSVAVLYLYGQRDSVDQFLVIFLAGVLLCYAQFPFFPSEPPRAVFFGEDFPSYDTVFRRLNWWMLGSYGIHTSVFPSAHVSGAFSAAFGARLVMPLRKWLYRFLFVIATLIAAATVYGRYHYLADAIAGFLISVVVAQLPVVFKDLSVRDPRNPGTSILA